MPDHKQKETNLKLKTLLTVAEREKRQTKIECAWAWGRERFQRWGNEVEREKKEGNNYYFWVVLTLGGHGRNDDDFLSVSQPTFPRARHCQSSPRVRHCPFIDDPFLSLLLHPLTSLFSSSWQRALCQGWSLHDPSVTSARLDIRKNVVWFHPFPTPVILLLFCRISSCDPQWWCSSIRAHILCRLLHLPSCLDISLQSRKEHKWIWMPSPIKKVNEYSTTWFSWVIDVGAACCSAAILWGQTNYFFFCRERKNCSLFIFEMLRWSYVAACANWPVSAAVAPRVLKAFLAVKVQFPHLVSPL